mgnify:CR=1 FL=1
MNTGLDSVSVADRPSAIRQPAYGAQERTVTGRPASELADVCIANLDPSLRVLEANGDFLDQFGRSASEVYGQSFGDFVHPSVKQLMLQHLARLSEGRRDRFSARMVGVRPSDAVFSARLTGVAVRGGTGKVSTIVVLMKPDRGTEAPKPGVDRRKLLSELDARVLEGVAAGISTVQLASKLYLSRQGIEYHVGAMLRRFKSPNRSALVAKAYSQGILCIGKWPPKVTPEYIR